MIDVPRYFVGSPLNGFEGDLDYTVLYAGESCSLVNDISRLPQSSATSHRGGSGAARTAELIAECVELVLLTILAIAGVFFGAALYVNLVEHPARVSCGAAAAVEEFDPAIVGVPSCRAASRQLAVRWDWLPHGNCTTCTLRLARFARAADSGDATVHSAY